MTARSTDTPTVTPIGAMLEALLADADIGVAILDQESRYLYVNRALGAAIRVKGDTGHRARADDYRSLPITPEGLVILQRVRETGAPILRTRRTLFGSTWESSCFPLHLDGRNLIGVIARDVTERETALTAAQHRSQRSAELALLSQHALEATDLQPLFDAAVVLLAEDLNVEFAKVLELLPDEQGMTIRADVGWRTPGSDESITIPTGAVSQAGYALTAEEPVILEDLERETRFRGSDLLISRGVRSGITVKINGRLGTWGVLAAHTRERRRFTDADADLAATVANILDAAIERDAVDRELERVAAQRRRLVAGVLAAADEERQRIADSLHDDALQYLLFARQECAAAAKAVTHPAWERAINSLDAATRALRSTVSHVHPATVDYGELRTSIEAVVDEYSRRIGTPITMAVPADVNSAHCRLVVSAVRELLTNVAKHAPGAKASVVIRPAGQLLLVEVSDDGQGFNPSIIETAVFDGHVGLASLHARVDAVGGRIEFLSADDRGTRVRLTLPRA